MNRITGRPTPRICLFSVRTSRTSAASSIDQILLAMRGVHNDRLPSAGDQLCEIEKKHLAILIRNNLQRSRPGKSHCIAAGKRRVAHANFAKGHMQEAVPSIVQRDVSGLAVAQL